MYYCFRVGGVQLRKLPTEICTKDIFLLEHFVAKNIKQFLNTCFKHCKEMCLLGTGLLVHAGIKVNHVSKRGPGRQGSNFLIEYERLAGTNHNNI